MRPSLAGFRRRAFLGALAWPALARAAAKRSLYVLPLGDRLAEVDVALVRDALGRMFGLPVAVLPAVALPESAFYPPRARYRADRLLTFLARRMPADGHRILGVTAVDISTRKGNVADWGVLGLGQLPGTACVISRFRCAKRSRGAEHARERLAKVAVHEIGHTLGLPHCPTRGCLMEDAGGKVVTLDREHDFCPRCRAATASSGFRLPDLAPPWGRPKAWLKGP